MSAKPAGRRVKVVKRKLADGTIREYRYDLQAKAAEKYVADQSDAIHKIALAYFASPEFRSLSPAWQQATRSYVSAIEDKLGWMTFADLAKREARTKFYELRDEYAATPVKSDRMIGVLKVLIAFGYERNQIDADHARGIPRLTPERPVRSEFIWRPEDEAAFVSAASPALRRAFLMALYTAARMSDLISLKWSNLDRAGWLSYQPSKTAKTTGTILSLPTFALPPLENVIKECPRTCEFILTNDDGLPWRRPTLQLHNSTLRAKLGLTDLHWHDLRGTAITRMLEASCTETEVAAITGHALVGGTMRKYAARTKPLALNAYTKWWAAMQPGKVVELTRENGAGKREK